MSYSPQLVYFLDRLAGFSTNVFKLEPQSTGDSIGAGKISRFTLPSNALLNMRSFAMHFNATCGSGTGARLPAKIDTLIDRVEVSAGGVQLSQGTNFYNVLRHVKDALQGSKCDSVCSHPEIVRAKSYVDASAITGTNNETYASTNNACQFTIDYWEGFLGTCEPKILDASILPDLVVTIYWATNNVLTSSGGITLSGTGATDIDDPPTPAAASYTINNLHATIETVGLADSVYDNMISSMIAQKGFVEIPFKQYFAFNNTHTGSSRFFIATQSLDRIWVATRVNTYDTLGAPTVVAGYKKAGAFTSSASIADTTTPSAIDQDIGKPDYDLGGSLDTNREKYLGKYYNFVEPSSAAGTKMTYQLQLNGAYYPQFAATAEQMYNISKNSVVGGGHHSFMTLDQYKKHYFVMCARLNMPDSEYSRTISGLDTRSVSLNGYFLTNNLGATHPNAMIFAECTSSLRVGAGRQLEVII